MRYLSGAEVAALLANLIHQGTQQHPHETDLTVGAIFRVTGGGALDFGGSEYAMAAREELTPEKASADEKYGWWNLGPGTYVVRYNETASLAETQVAFVQPHERLLLAGGSHPTFYFRGQRDQLETLLTVGEAGLRIKENARLSKLLVLQLDG
jgi:hypothetical protein